MFDILELWIRKAQKRVDAWDWPSATSQAHAAHRSKRLQYIPLKDKRRLKLPRVPHEPCGPAETLCRRG